LVYYLWIKRTYGFCSNLFALSDTDGDGKMTFAEWRDSSARSTFTTESDSMLYEQWAKYDTGNVGYLTKDEAMNKKA
jgi:Ca2+-binding EF-hand superfamily protein